MYHLQIHAEIAALEQKLQSCKEELTTLQASPAVNGCGLEAVEKDRVGGDDREGDDGGARGMEQVGVANGQAEKEDVGKMSRAQKRKVSKYSSISLTFVMLSDVDQLLTAC